MTPNPLPPDDIAESLLAEADGLETCSIELGKKPIRNPVSTMRLASARLRSLAAENERLKAEVNRLREINETLNHFDAVDAGMILS